MQTQRPFRTVFAVGLLYVAMAVLWVAPSSLSPARTIPDLGDPLHLAWVMAWDAHQIVRHPLSLFSANTFYPYPRSLTFGDHLLPEALMVAPVFWLTGNCVLSSNLAVLLALVLSAMTLFWLVWDVTQSPAAAFLAGLFYAFNSFTRGEILRVQVLNLEWWPLAFLALERFTARGERRYALGFGVALLLQALSGAYYLIYSALLAPLWLILAYVAHRRMPARRELATLGVILLGAALLTIPILWPYAVQLRSMGFEKPLRVGVDALSYLEPTSPVLSRLRFLPPQGSPDFLGFLGAPLMVLGAVLALRRGLLPRTRVLGFIALGTALVGFSLSVGPAISLGGLHLGPGPYALLYRYFPPTRGMSSPVRAVALVLLGGALLLGLALAFILERLKGSVRLAVVGLLSVLLPLEHWSPTTTGAEVPTGRDVPEVYRFLAAESSEPMVDLPLYPDVAKRFWALYLYFSTYHWRPIPIGRTSFYPPAHDYLAWSLRGFPDDLSIELLGHLGIRTLVVHPLVWEDPKDREQRLEALDRDARLRLVKEFSDDIPKRYSALQLGGERVYRLLPEQAQDAPSLCKPSGELDRVGWVFGGTGVVQGARAADADRKTAWFTATPQRPGDRLEITFPRPERISALAIDLWYPHAEFPRNLVLLLRGEGEGFQRVRYADGARERSAVIDALVKEPREAAIVLRFAPQTARAVRLMVGWREGDPAWPAWSVPELHAYRDCR